MIEETVYLRRNNTIELLLQDNRLGFMSNADLTNVTKIDLFYGETSISSATYPTLITWTDGGAVSLKLGSLTLLPSRYPAYLVLYDAANPEGIRWKDFILCVEEA